MNLGPTWRSPAKTMLSGHSQRDRVAARCIQHLGQVILCGPSHWLLLRWNNSCAMLPGHVGFCEMWDHCALGRLWVAWRWRLPPLLEAEQWMATVKFLHIAPCGILLLSAPCGALLPRPWLLC